MRTLEDNSPDWVQIGELVQKTLKPLREIGRENGVSDTAIRKQMKKQGWQRPAANQVPREPNCEPPPTRVEATAKVVAAASVKDLTGRGRNIILSLMTELDIVNEHIHLLREIVECDFDGAKDAKRKARLEKLLSYETRAKTANYLATALAKLNDAAPGKKEQARADADTAGQDSEWGDDLNSGAARPN